METELQEIDTRDEQSDNRAQMRTLLAFGVPVFIAGLLLLVRGIQDWGAPAIVAGFILGALGLSIAVIAISVSGSRGGS